MIYLPHGVCVLATMLYGWRAIAALAAGIVGGHVVFSETLFPAGVSEAFLPIIITASGSFIAFEIFRYLGKNHYASASGPAHWRSVFSVGVVAAFIAAFGQTALGNPQFFQSGNLGQYMTFVVTNVAGMMTLFVMLMFSFRWARLVAR